MRFGPITVSLTGIDAGVWYEKPGGAPQNITIPALLGAVLALGILCCCARVVL